MTKIGYARVSTDDQSADAQRAALVDAGVVTIFVEYASGANMERPQMRKAIAMLGPGDVLVVWKIDRLARSLSDLLSILATLKARGADFCSLTESVDTTSAAGVMLLHVLAAFAQFERAILVERTRLGVATAKKNGVKLGRRPLARPDQERVWVASVEDGDVTIREAARGLNVSKTTMNRILARHRAKKGTTHEDDSTQEPPRARAAKTARESAARRDRDRRRGAA